MKTLIILTGNARGGEETWDSMYENLMKPYNADLSICFGKTDDHNSLYEKSKYVWEIDEYSNWIDYYQKNCSNFWCENLEYGKSGDVLSSGIIGFAIKHFIIKNYEKILLKYDRIILTRSDYFYAHRYPLLSNKHLWIVEGENYGSYCDRFYVFPSKYCKKVMNIVDYIDSEHLNSTLRLIKKYNLDVTGFGNGYINTEYYYKLFFEYNGISKIIRRSPRVQFLVSTTKDTNRTNIPKIKYKNNLFVRYESEFKNCFERIKLFKVPNYIQ